MGRRRSQPSQTSQVIVQGPTQEELAQREEQFRQQMALLQKQSDEQQAALVEQLRQQEAAAQAQQKSLREQLTAQGNINAANSLSALLNLLSGQTGVAQEGVLEREKLEATSTAQAKQTTRANIGRRQQAQSLADLITQLTNRGTRNGRI